MLVFALVYALELRAKYNAVDRNLIFLNIEISDFSRKILRIRSKFRDSEITQIDAQWPMANGLKFLRPRFHEIYLVQVIRAEYNNESHFAAQASSNSFWRVKDTYRLSAQ